MMTLTIAQEQKWKIESGAMPDSGVIHITDIKPTLIELEKYLDIDLQNNTVGSAGKRTYSGDIDIAINISTDKVDDFISKLKSIPNVLEVKKTSIIMTTVKIPNWNPVKYKGVNGTGYVQIDFMFSSTPEFLKLFYHSPYEQDSKYKGIYRNILLGAIAHFYDIRYSTVMLNDVPQYEERYFWSADLGLYRGRSYRFLDKTGKKLLKKKINSMYSIDQCYKTAENIVEKLNLIDANSLYSFETLFNDINTRYDSKLLSLIYDEFINNRYVKEMGIPTELLNYYRN